MTEGNEINLDEIQQVPLMGEFVKKQDLLGKKTKVKILGFAKGMYKHPLVNIEVDGKEKVLDFNVRNKKSMIENFGSKARDWIGKEVILTAHKIEYSNKDGNMVSGIEVIFSPVKTDVEEEDSSDEEPDYLD